MTHTPATWELLTLEQRWADDDCCAYGDCDQLGQLPIAGTTIRLCPDHAEQRP